MAAQLVRMSMSDKRFEEISQHVRQSYPNSCILWVDEIDNAFLRDSYEVRKEAMIAERGADVVKELTLFHGTSERAALQIAKGGFDVSYSKIAVYGSGTYFASAASMSMYYTKDNKEKICFMLMNKVLLGTTAQYGSSAPINTKIHDNSVNTPVNPTIIVSPYNDGALPQYMIAFYRNAK
jgi:hypothetical protein